MQLNLLAVSQSENVLTKAVTSNDSDVTSPVEQTNESENIIMQQEVIPDSNDIVEQQHNMENGEDKEPMYTVVNTNDLNGIYYYYYYYYI